MNHSSALSGFGLAFMAYVLCISFAIDGGGAMLWTLTVVCGLAALLFLLALVLSKETTQTTSAAPSPAPAAKPKQPAGYYDYKGDVHDVIDIEGIGPKFEKLLKGAGIHNTAQLCHAGAEVAAKVCGVPLKTANKWIAMCQLVKVNGIGKQYAEALVRGGVHSIQELKKGDPAKLADQVTRYLESLNSNVLGQKVTMRRVQGWQQKAAGMRKIRMAVP